MHFPGQNYTGPGTRVATNIYNNVKPTNKTDAVTMLHDIDYIRFAGSPKHVDQADYYAIQNSDNSAAGIATKVGLAFRTEMQLRFANNGSIVRSIGNHLLTKVEKDYSDVFERYGISLLAHRQQLPDIEETTPLTREINFIQ